MSLTTHYRQWLVNMALRWLASKRLLRHCDLSHRCSYTWNIYPPRKQFRGFDRRSEPGYTAGADCRPFLFTNGPAEGPHSK